MRVPGEAGVPGVPSLDMLSYDSPGLNCSTIFQYPQHFSPTNGANELRQSDPTKAV